jgi:hypothetical protein
MTKFKNVPVVHEGERFDSRRELKYFLDFQLRQKAGEISFLKRQPKFPLEINGVKIGTYIADFEFVDKGRRRVIDVKSPVTAKLPLFKLKQKLVRAIHGIDVEVVL